jgi:hypothetical protein
MNEAERLVQRFKAERDDALRIDAFFRRLHWVNLVAFSLINIVISIYWITTTSTNPVTLMTYCISYFAALTGAYYSYTQLKGDET